MKQISTTFGFSAVDGAEQYGVKWAVCPPGDGHFHQQPDIIIKSDGRTGLYNVTLPTPEGCQVVVLFSACLNGNWGLSRRYQYVAQEAILAPAPETVMMTAVSAAEVPEEQAAEFKADAKAEEPPAEPKLKISTGE